MGNISGTTGLTVIIHLSKFEFCKETGANAAKVATLWGKMINVDKCLEKYYFFFNFRSLSKSQIFLHQIGPDFQKANFTAVKLS